MSDNKALIAEARARAGLLRRLFGSDTDAIAAIAAVRLGEADMFDRLAAALERADADMQRSVAYVVWDRNYDVAYRGRLYDSEAKARNVLGGIVWHSRDRYDVRRVLIDAARAAAGDDHDRAQEET